MSANLPQMAFILRAKQGRRAMLERQVREATAELNRIEADYARTVGMPSLRGDALLKAIEAESELAKRRGRVA